MPGDPISRYRKFCPSGDTISRLFLAEKLANSGHCI
jgi:hypothetical protein